jgi:DNA-binding NtrC family response regulator
MKRPSPRGAEGCLEHGRFDLIILSHGREVPDVRRLMRFTLGRNRYTPVVVLTRCVEIEYYIEAMQLGAADYLEKPLSPLQLKRLVATHCKPLQDEIVSFES